MAFLINEDQALKEHLSGLTVADQNDATRPVKVYFRLPEAEERPVTYPFITIDLIDIEEEKERAHRGLVEILYDPEGYTNPIPDSRQRAEFPTPVSIIYQVTTFTRSAWHDRQLMAAMYGGKIPLRYGHLDVDADETIRRLDFLDMQSLDGVDRNKKRVFRKAYTIAVSAELFLDTLESATPVGAVDITTFHQLEPYIVA